MKLILAAILTTILIVSMSLGAMYILVRTTQYVSTLKSPFQWGVAVTAELILGVILLLGTVWLATHLAVRIFGKNPRTTPGGPLA
jgi:hypothetical protein